MDRPFRIALFTGNYVHIEDGVSRTLGRLVEYLLAEGHEVLVLGPTVDHPPMSQPGTFRPVPSVPIPIPGRSEYRFSTRFPASARRAVEAFAPDIVHIATPDVLGHRALTWAIRQDLPVVSTYHTHFISYLDYYDIGFVRPLFVRIAQRFYNRCDEVYAPTEAMIDDLREQGVTSTLRLWPRGIELDRFAPSKRSEEWRQEMGFGQDEIVVTFVSRVVKEKGIDVFSSVLSRLQMEGLPIRALVVGDGPEREALSTTLPSAIFTGHLSGEALARAYASSDIFLFPSETETFGNVTLEAMASGLAAVCADAAGSRSLIDAEESGLLCPPRDVDAFAAAVRRLVLNEDLRRRLGNSGREAARQYNWTSVLARMVTYYRGVANRTPAVPDSVRA